MAIFGRIIDATSQFQDYSGKNLSAGTVFVGEEPSTTVKPAELFAVATSQRLTNPLIIGANGLVEDFLVDSEKSYYIIVKDLEGNEIYSRHNISTTSTTGSEINAYYAGDHIEITNEHVINVTDLERLDFEYPLVVSRSEEEEDVIIVSLDQRDIGGIKTLIGEHGITTNGNIISGKELEERIDAIATGCEWKPVEDVSNALETADGPKDLFITRRADDTNNYETFKLYTNRSSYPSAKGPDLMLYTAVNGDIEHFMNVKGSSIEQRSTDPNGQIAGFSLTGESGVSKMTLGQADSSFIKAEVNPTNLEFIGTFGSNGWELSSNVSGTTFKLDNAVVPALTNYSDVDTGHYVLSKTSAAGKFTLEPVNNQALPNYTSENVGQYLQVKTNAQGSAEAQWSDLGNTLPEFTREDDSKVLTVNYDQDTSELTTRWLDATNIIYDDYGTISNVKKVEFEASTEGVAKVALKNDYGVLDTGILVPAASNPDSTLNYNEDGFYEWKKNSHNEVNLLNRMNSTGSSSNTVKLDYFYVGPFSDRQYIDGAIMLKVTAGHNVSIMPIYHTGGSIENANWDAGDSTINVSTSLENEIITIPFCWANRKINAIGIKGTDSTAVELITWWCKGNKEA